MRPLRTPSLATLTALAVLALASPGSPVPAAARAETPASLPAQSPGLAAARAWRQTHGAAVLRELAEFLALPNVADDTEGIRANARWLLDAFSRRGARMELLEVPGAPPVVFGELGAQGPGAAAAPTLVIYAHYDGQPVDPQRWTWPPWQPTLTHGSLEAGGGQRPFPEAGEAIDPEWRIYARSSGDDKAPIQALLSALDALAAADVHRSVNLKLFFEGEEEAGSPHLRQVVERWAPRLGGDVWLFMDGPIHQTGRPQLFFGARGIVTLDLTVYGARRYLHSGHYGNWAPNPNLELARLLAGMKDEHGRVLVAGFYDSVLPVGEAEKAALAAAPDFESELRRELGLAESEGGNGERYLERLLLPSLNVRGLAGASVGQTARNVIPPEATAALDLRLVAGNDPEAMLDLVEAHIRAQGYHIVREEPDQATRLAHSKIVRVVRGGGYPAVRTAMDLPIVRRIIAAAEAAAKTTPEAPLVLTPTLGGSLPLYVFDEVLGAPFVGVPIANHDDNQHAPDENLRLGNLFYGIDLAASLLTLEPAAEAP